MSEIASSKSLFWQFLSMLKNSACSGMTVANFTAIIGLYRDAAQTKVEFHTSEYHHSVNDGQGGILSVIKNHLHIQIYWSVVFDKSMASMAAELRKDIAKLDSRMARIEAKIQK